VAVPRTVPAREEPFSAGPSAAPVGPTASRVKVTATAAPLTVREPPGKVERVCSVTEGVRGRAHRDLA
jgi:hypothetical protein